MTASLLVERIPDSSNAIGSNANVQRQEEGTPKEHIHADKIVG